MVGLNKVILALCIAIAMLIAAISASACETDQCRAAWGHRGGGAFVGSASVAIFQRINGADHPIKTGLEALAFSIAISAITEATVGAHGKKPSGKDFGQWVQGNLAGVGANLFILEYKF